MPHPILFNDEMVVVIMTIMVMMMTMMVIYLRIWTSLGAHLFCGTALATGLPATVDETALQVDLA
jgi:hypothetical protein